jgi:hypothetical protein
MVWSVVFWQAACTLGTVGFVYWFVIRGWRRAGHLTFDGMFCLAGSLLYWQDYLINWSNMLSSYNAGMWNVGSWYNFIPGWVPGNGRHFAEAPFFAGGFYTWGILGFAMIANFAMRRVRHRWPNISKFRLVLVALAVGMYLDLCIEMLWIYGGLYHYSGFPGPKFFAGHYYAFPLMENLAWGSACAAFAALRFFRNDKGQTIAERGVEDVKFGHKGKVGLRMLALFGALSTIYLGYNLSVNLVAGLHPQAWPEDTLKRSYFTQTQCGAATQIPCPDPNLPIFTRGGFTILPDGSVANPAGTARLPKAVPQTKCPGSPADAPLTGTC